MATIKIEGQTIKGDAVGITDEIANDDELLKAALAPTWPDVRTATITRTGGTDGKELVVSVVKKAGTKGVHTDKLEERERFRLGAEREAERVRKLEDLALAADSFLKRNYGVETYDLTRAFNQLGDHEIARIRDKRRGA